MTETQNNSNSINIKLGDIIQINSPTNSNLNNKNFYVKYINLDKLALIDTISLDEVILNINEDGSLSDESIVTIFIINRDPKNGYALQNNLLPDKWINIEFGGDLPTIITGVITNLEEDMIEIKTYPDNEIIYIDFAYKGIPEDIPIKNISIREKPEEIVESEKKEVLADLPEKISEDEIIDLPVEEIKTQLKEIIIDADEIQFGNDLDSITQVVDIPEGEQRFGIEKQTNDLLDVLLSNIPNAKRSDKVLNDIHTMIERFKQLRSMYSEFDNYGNITKAVFKDSEYKPLLEKLYRLQKNLFWILPVAKNKKKIYDTDTYDDNYDVVSLDFNKIMNKEQNVIDIWKSNNIPDDENKYDYLYKSLNSFYTPFTLPDYLDNNIITKEVNTNITAVIDNLENLYSTVVGNDNVSRKRFLIQKYNLGLTRIKQNRIQGNEYVNKVVDLTPNDKITIKSALILPEITIKFSHVDLPSTNILDKANLNLNFLNYWQFLKNNTNVKQIIIDNFDDQPSSDDYFKEITQFILDESLIENTEDGYKKYLNTIIPNSHTLFELIKNYIKGGLSLYDVISYLEPFMIYHNDLSYKQYEVIIQFINSKIIDYKEKYIENFKTVQAYINGNEENVYKNNIVDILNENPEIKNMVFEAYGIDNDFRKNLNDIELLKIMNSIDYTEFLTTAISKINNTLLVSNNFDKIDEISENLNQESINNEDCDIYVLTKRYIAIDELLDDNDNTIYFDKQYDNTYYDIIDDYKNEQSIMNNIEFFEFLKNKLIENIGLNEENATRDAEALIAGKRVIKDNDYALLETDDNRILYYKRIDNKWALDENVSSTNFATKNKMFCNLQNNCFDINDKCLNKDNAINIVDKNSVNSIIDNFDKTYELNKSALIEEINKKYNINFNRLINLRFIEKMNLLKYNNQKISIANTLEQYDVISSPYEELRDKILGQSDFVKRQNDIIRFVNNFTRNPKEFEDKYWLYCIKTDIKLLPLFLLRLADAFIKRENYLYALDTICAEQGTISDDGEKWVDKHSGYIIKNIDFDTEEGFTQEGFKLITREIMEKDLGNAILQSSDSKQVFIDPQTKPIINIVDSMAGFMGIDLSSKIDFIVKNVLATQKISVPSNSDYNKLLEKAASKSKKKFPSYEEVYNSSLVYLTLSYFLVAIQISIPSINTRKTFPGCIRSFTGFPINGTEDKSALLYIACVANKIKSSIEPWNAIKKSGENSIANKMQAIIEKYILTNNVILQDFKEKLEYIKLNEMEDIPIEHDIINWVNFLPPLQNIISKNVTNVSNEFKNKLIENIKSGSNEQFKQLSTLQSKNIYFSMEIIKAIQNVINNKLPLLTNSNMEPFLENACCDSDIPETLSYFIEKDSNIEVYNNNVKKITELLANINFITKASIMYDPKNTKYIYPTIGDNFSEETIYRAFIVYCKYNSDIPIDADLRAVCMEKPDDFNVNDSIQEKINSLKQQNKVFNNESLQNLMLIINRKNIVNIHYNNPDISYIQRLRNLLLSIEERNPDNIPSSFTEKFLLTLDTYDVAIKDDTSELRDFKNYLSKINEKSKVTIFDFIKRNTNITRSKMKLIETCYNSLLSFEDTDNERIYKNIHFMNNTITEIIKVIPNMIINEVKTPSDIPKHWNLTPTHKNDIINIMTKYYSNFYSFYNDKQINKVLNIIQNSNNDIIELANNTPFMSPINGNELITSIFNKKLTSLLFKFYFNNIFIDYINIVDNLPIDFTEQPISKDTIEMIDNNEIPELEMIIGEKKQMKQKIADLLYNYLQLICNNKKITDFTYNSITEKIMRSKVKEKDLITNFLKELTDEEREIENVFKNNKLERWSVGLQKGLTQYVGSNYDEERKKLEKQALMEKKLGVNDDVTNMNRDIFALDAIEEEMISNEIEREEYDMSHVIDDDDNSEFLEDTMINYNDDLNYGNT